MRGMKAHIRRFLVFTFKPVPRAKSARGRNGIGVGYVLRHGAFLPCLDRFRIAAGGGRRVAVCRNRCRRSHGLGDEPPVGAQYLHTEDEASPGRRARRPPLARALRSRIAKFPPSKVSGDCRENCEVDREG